MPSSPTAPRKSHVLFRLLAASSLLAAGACATTSGQQHYDVVIHGGTIYDGSDAKPFVGDVALTGDRIVYVGPSAPGAASRTIEAQGMIVTPGFIDAHTHADVFIRSPDPAQRVNAAWLDQGASTVVIGVDGGGTPDVADDARKLQASGIGTNAVPFVGFGAVRERVLGDDARAPDAAELDKMKALVAKGMCEGAVGFSTGLFYAPQSFAKTEEVVAVAREAAKRGGIYDTHQRDESSYTIGLLGSVDEAIRIGREAGMPVHFAHIKALGVDVQGEAGDVIARINKARAQGIDVTADQYPWLASGSSLDASLLPRWSVDGGDKALLARLDDPATNARIRKEMIENMRRRGGPSSLLLTAQGYPWTGKTLAQIAGDWNIDPIEAALRIIRQSAEKGGGGTDVASFNMAEPDVEQFMKQPWIVTSSDGSNGHPRMFATYPEKYVKYVKERKVIDLGTFVRQSTGRVADIYKIDHRGYLKPGYFADVLVFDPDHFAPRADYVHPRELSVGVKALFVNGTLAVENSQTTGARPGRVLLRPAPAGCP
ncbi:N-acyl-D-amino-acid deacylase family protein [Novosphingobium naphthalenivorans]|uniref:N-acyl-D-amino-acid deacylase family protein n=1 Tax=Novosphingobium naphthalenivorans TaxID=273168 RepID=UPI00082D14E0|nr:amidohydrolase family protein [Novosphingobium naphthalenivorans]